MLLKFDKNLYDTVSVVISDCGGSSSDFISNNTVDLGAGPGYMRMVSRKLDAMKVKYTIQKTPTDK